MARKAAQTKVKKAAGKIRVKKAPPLPEIDPLDTSPSDEELATLLDIKPTPAYPGVYIGRMNGKQRLRAALAYHRDDHYVWTVMFSPSGGSRIIKKFNALAFDDLFERAHFPHRVGPVYSLERGLEVFLKPGAVYNDNAYRVLTKLQRGQDPMEEESLDDLLDTTPSAVPQRRKGRVRTMSDKLARREKRKARLAGMTPAQLRAWRDKRNARRRLRRLNAKKEKAK